MTSLKTIIVAAALSALFAGYAQAETLKPMQGVSSTLAPRTRLPISSAKTAPASSS